MSDSVWSHRLQPTRLPRPWNSPGKNTGVGCHFLFQCVKVKSESEVAQSCPTLSDPMDRSLPGSSIHGIFQARVLEWGAIAFSGEVKSLAEVVELDPCSGSRALNAHHQPLCCAAVLSLTTPSIAPYSLSASCEPSTGMGWRRGGPCSQSLQINTVKTVKFSLGFLIFPHKKRVLVLDIPCNLKASEHSNYLQWLLVFHSFININNIGLFLEGCHVPGILLRIFIGLLNLVHIPSLGRDCGWGNGDSEKLLWPR